jgi:hypothetical protein
MPSIRDELNKKMPKALAVNRLAELAFSELHKANRSPGIAVEGFWPQVAADGELTVALMRAVPQQLRVAAMSYLYERLKDMEGAILAEFKQGASLRSDESQSTADRPSTSSGDSGASQRTSASLHPADRPLSPNGGRPSQTKAESHRRHDRPAPRTKAPAAKSKISRNVVLKYASNSIFALKVGPGERYLGSFTRPECRDWAKKSMVLSNLFSRFVTEVQWPDDKTELAACAPEEMVRTIHNGAYAMLDNLGLTNVSK